MMPFQGLLRRNRKSDTDLRTVSVPNNHVPAVRSSEHVPRLVGSANHGLSPDDIRGEASASSSQPSLATARHLSPSRFGMMKSRNASDSQLSLRAKLQSGKDAGTPPVPAMPTTPAIITTCPTVETFETPQKKKSRLKLPSLMKPSSDDKSSSGPSPKRGSFSERRRGSEIRQTRDVGLRMNRVTFDESGRRSMQAPAPPPPYGDHAGSALALPVSRLSESSRSDRSSGDNVAYATTTMTHTVSTTTTFFRLPRRKKTKTSLFPLPAKTPTSEFRPSTGEAPRTSAGTQPDAVPQNASASPSLVNSGSQTPLPSPSHVALAASSMNFVAPATAMFRRDSTASTRSSKSSPSLAPPLRLGLRGRSSTAVSTNRHSEDPPLPTPPLPSGRTSTSTAGRNSLGGIFSLSQRLRNTSEPPIPRRSSPGTPGSSTSKSASFNLTRDSIVVPQRQDEDTPAKYLSRLEEAVSRSVIACVLSRSSDVFSQNVLRSYMRSFAFFEDPMDMAIRKLLMEVELPKETQQIDRVLQGFADRYHECNPGIYASPDQAYFIAFSLLILHTDVFNKNNKHKMQRQDYLKNTRGEGVSDDILECFYDNIAYTPFIHVEDDLDIHGERIMSYKPRKTMFPRGSVDPSKRSQKEPVDPYTLIIDRKLETLRPTLKEVMNLDDTYNYLGTASSLDLPNLQKTFFKSGVLQIVSARSRPDAFMSPSTITNPEEAHPGLVDIKITKVGLLWRKEAKKKKTRSPWQEWGAILTGSQLFLFRNTTWIKSLIHQHDSHHKQGFAGSPVIFKPPVENFKPEALMSTQDAVALLDSNYKKHKNAFMFVRHGGLEETFLADNENEMNDWLAKLNYAAAFRTSGVRMRGLVGGNYEGQRSRGIRRMDTDTSGRSVQSPTGEVSIFSGKIDTKLAQQILTARREIMTEKIGEAVTKLTDDTREMDGLLRNARHLQILAPIQAKTREQVVFAAGRLAAQLKWKRMEVWRRKCHRDILALDLEDETQSSAEVQLRNRTLSGTRNPAPTLSGPQNNDLSRIESSSSPLPGTQRTPGSPNLARPSTNSSGNEFSMEEIFKSPPETAMQNKHKGHTSWELPPLTFNAQAPTRDSLSSVSRRSPRPESLAHQLSTASGPAKAREASIPDSLRIMTRTPTLKDDDSEVFKEGDYVDPDVLAAVRQQSEAGSEPEDQLSLPPDGTGKSVEGHDKHKVRRSLHRTLREAHIPTHHRSKKGKDSSSSVGVSDDANSINEGERLARGTGSFTVHGKKASVINFGSEWQNMSPEERLRLRKQAHNEDSSLITTYGLEDGRNSPQELLMEALRRRSETSLSTTTAPVPSAGQGDSSDVLPAAQSEEDENVPGDISVAHPEVLSPTKQTEVQETIPLDVADAGESGSPTAESTVIRAGGDSEDTSSTDEFQDAPTTNTERSREQLVSA